MNRKIMLCMLILFFLAWFLSLYYLVGYTELKLGNLDLDGNAQRFRKEIMVDDSVVDYNALRALFEHFLEGQMIANAGMKTVWVKAARGVIILISATSVLFWFVGLYCHKKWTAPNKTGTSEKDRLS